MTMLRPPALALAGLLLAAGCAGDPADLVTEASAGSPGSGLLKAVLLAVLLAGQDGR